MSKLFRMAYVSGAAVPFNRVMLIDLLEQASKRNASAGVTGLLLYKDSQFMQILEGPESAVKATFKRVSRDRRHHGIIVLLKEPASERFFPDSSMAFRDLDLPEHQKVPGYKEFLDTPLTGKEFAAHPSRCEQLLLLFKKVHPRKH
jgi:Sensors of blue-light using FAD